MDDTIETMRNIKFIAAKTKKTKYNLGFTLDRLVIMKNEKNEEKHMDKQTNQSVQYLNWPKEHKNTQTYSKT